jgi:hypothetical protein
LSPVTAAKFINKKSLFILLLGFVRRLELKPNSEQKVETRLPSATILANPILAIRASPCSQKLCIPPVRYLLQKIIDPVSSYEAAEDGSG